MDKNKKLIIVIIILAVIAGGVSFFAVHEAQKNKEMSELFAVEKEEMENEYSTFATQYNELQIQINNDSLREKLESEKLKTQRLLEELRQVKNKYSAATAQISTLSKEKKSLNEKVSLAAQLDATNIIVNPMNKRGKTARKVKDVKKISIQFTIVKNITAETGNKTLYIRIAKPDNDILTKSEANTFAYEDRNIGYSIKKYIEYTGEEQTVTVYWNVEEFLPSGNYRVYIFADGNMIGQGSFSMK